MLELVLSPIGFGSIQEFKKKFDPFLKRFCSPCLFRVCFFRNNHGHYVLLQTVYCKKP